jgi:cytochrome c556
MDFYDDYRDPAVLHVKIKENKKMNTMKNTIDGLSKLTDQQLADELSRQISFKKQNGTMGDIEKLVKTITPFLTDEQKTRLDNIVKTMQGG